MTRLQSRPVIVTGGGSGIGQGTCLRIAEEDARVTVADIRLAMTEETAELVRGHSFVEHNSARRRRCLLRHPDRTAVRRTSAVVTARSESTAW